MLLADSAKAREIDRLSIERYKIPSLLLMENAGMRVADEAVGTGAQKFAVLAGKGNNGGDGSAAARHLFCRGKDVVLILPDKVNLNGDAKTMYDTACNSGVNIITGFTDKAVKCLEDCDVVIDAMFGIGFKGVPRRPYSEVITVLNSLDKYVIAVDVPSGVNADNGRVDGDAVRCKKTVTFSAGRLGLMLYPAKSYAGEVCVHEISFVPQAVKSADIKVKTLEYMPVSPIGDDCHKGSVGRVLVAAGSEGMTGAACIASTAALRSGSGLVTLCIPKTINNVVSQKLTEIMTVPVEDNGKTMTEESAAEIIHRSSKFDSLVLGCGLGNNEDTAKLVNKVISETECRIIIDADGLNCMDKNVLKKRKNAVITPHIGEMARLTGLEAEQVKSNLVKVASDFAAEYGTAVVLKCATTVVAFPDGEIYVSTIGNNGMATAGSGDVLAGVIGSQISQTADFKTAVINGVWLHSAAGDEAAKKLGRRYMSATDIIQSLKYVLNR